MDTRPKNSKQMLENALDVIRNAEPDKRDMESRAARVWSRIAAGSQTDEATAASTHLRTCADYQALIPAFIAGQLSPARALLFKDHTHECMACHNALTAARSGARVAPAARPAAAARWRRPAAVLAVAAALIAGVALQQAGYLNFLLPVFEVEATAQTIDGQLFRIAGVDLNPVRAGDALEAGQMVRTGAGSGAIIALADGTRIEMRERSQLSLTGAHDGIRVNLDRGSIIVEAAKQRDGHLYVATDDCSISVVGTVFAVSSGVKGSRVSVLEGEVRVSQSTTGERALLPGEQLTTADSLTGVPIEEEISWSRNLDTHLALLRTLAEVNAFLRDRIPGPQLRFTSALLPLVPANTVIYGAFPNVSSALGQAYDMFVQKIDQNPLLRQWWADQRSGGDEQGWTLEEMIRHVRNLGSQLGDEVAIAVGGGGADTTDVVVLADVRNPSGAFAELSRIFATMPEDQRIRILTDPAELAGFTGNEQGPLAYLGERVLALASSPQAIYHVIVAERTGGSPFTGTPFHGAIARAYSEGTGSLFAADLASLLVEQQQITEAESLGLASIDRFVVEQKQHAGQTTTRAQLSFNAERSGIASWIAAPAPMGGLEFVSPQAYGVASAVTKDALGILEDVLAFGGSDGDGIENLEEFERETRLNVRQDLAAPLGGEFLLAIDGPFLPVPSWKVVVEVYDAARLQNTIEWLVMQIRDRKIAAGESGVSVSSEFVNGQTFYTIRHDDGTAGPEFHYTYALGYLIAAPSRGLVAQALQYQQSRSSILESTTFRSMMPADGGDHCSAILYQNLTEAANSIAGAVPAVGITPEQLQMLRDTASLTPATLVCAAAEPNRIVMGYQGDLAFQALMLGGLRNMMVTLNGQ